MSTLRVYAVVLAAFAFGAAQGPPGVDRADPMIAAAGDIACDPANASFKRGVGTARACRMRATSDLLVGMDLAAVLTLGDNQYEDGALAKFKRSYGPTWGRVKSITHPVTGNHEYFRSNGSGYFAYFGSAAGDPAKGYYSYNIGAWHIVALNSTCSRVGGCRTGSPQERWLRADLAANRAMCTLAYWHHPRFSSGFHGSNPAYDAFWRALYEAGADVVLAGHDHSYERFAPQDPRGRADPVRGIREFVVGTGGRNHYRFRTIQPNSALRHSGTFGVLVMTLSRTGYEWRFVPESGRSFTDSGRGSCH